MLSQRFDIKYSVDQSKFDLVAKSESRPYVLDWDRDGNNDLVVVQQEDKITYDQNKKPEFRAAYRLFVDTESA